MPCIQTNLQLLTEIHNNSYRTCVVYSRRWRWDRNSSSLRWCDGKQSCCCCCCCCCCWWWCCCHKACCKATFVRHSNWAQTLKLKMGVSYFNVDDCHSWGDGQTHIKSSRNHICIVITPPHAWDWDFITCSMCMTVSSTSAAQHDVRHTHDHTSHVTGHTNTSHLYTFDTTY